MPTDSSIGTRRLKRDRHSQIPAKVEKFATQSGTVETMFIVQCDRCGQKHRHRTDGWRVSGCRQGLYLVVAA